MVTPTSEALSRADTAWFHAEAPTNHFVVTSLALCDAPVDVDRFRTMLSRRIEGHPRLRQVVAEPQLPVVPARWIPAPNFDLDAHMHRVALPKPSGERELAGLIGDLAGQPLDLSRPLWEVHLVDGPGAGGAFICRLHHSLGDGQAMVRMLLSLTDDTATGWKLPPTRLGRASRRTRTRIRPRRAPSRHDGLSSAPRLALQAVRGAGTLARLTLLDADQRTPLRGDLSLLKAVAWTNPLPLHIVKRIAAMSGSTVNDVVVSSIAGGLGAYLRETGVNTNGLRIRAMVPVNLRPADDTGMTGNRFSLVYVELPVGVTGAWERLMRVKIEMDRIKDSMEPAVGWLLVQSLGLLPAGIERLASAFYADKASLVLTNVIGPQQRIFIAGTPVRQMTFWEPESGGLGIGVSIYSYAGEITVGVVSDRNLVARPHEIIAAVETEFVELVRASGIRIQGMASHV